MVSMAVLFVATAVAAVHMVAAIMVAEAVTAMATAHSGILLIISAPPLAIL